MMRTTLDLPDELLKRAKIAAVERGATLRELVAAALERELSIGATPPQPVDLPILEVREDCPLLSMTPEDIKRLEAQQDAEALLAIHSGH